MSEEFLKVQYVTEIYEPGSADDVWVTFRSQTPLFSFSKGDIINTGMDPNATFPKRVLKVVAVEHMIWEMDDSSIKNKICVFTESGKNTRELRTGLV